MRKNICLIITLTILFGGGIVIGSQPLPLADPIECVTTSISAVSLI